MEIYTDGSCILGEDGKMYLGLGIYFGNNDSRNISETIICKSVNQQTMEILAVLRALQLTIGNKNITVLTDSLFVVNALNVKCKKHIVQGINNRKLQNVPCYEIIVQCMDIINKRQNWNMKTLVKHVKGHSSSKGNREADRLAGLASHRFIMS